MRVTISTICICVMRLSSAPWRSMWTSSLQLRVNLVDQALLSAEQCTKVAPEYSDGYLLLGLAQIKKGRQAEGIANLQKAKELGNPQADGLIEKYSK